MAHLAALNHRCRDLGTRNEERGILNKSKINKSTNRKSTNHKMKNPFHTEMIATFCNWYSKAKGIRYNFLSIDARKIDELYVVLRAHWDEKRPDKPPSCLEFQEYFLHFLDYIPRLHKWLFANLDLKNIASKAQIIIALIEDNRRGAEERGRAARTPYAPKDLQTRLELLNAMTND